jgi:proliferating cell nuclear antigen
MRLAINDPAKADIFSQLLQPIKNFTDSINIIFKEDELYVQCMDASTILIMLLILPKEWFCEYEVEKDEVIGVSTSILSKVLSIKDKSQGLMLTTKEDNGDQLFVKFHCEDTKLVFDKMFDIPLLDLDSDLLDIPDMDYSADFSLPSIVFSSMIHQLKQFGDVMRIECTEEHIELISESVEFGKMNTHIPIQDLEEYSIEEDGTIRGSYALKYLNLICLYQKVSKHMDVGVSKNFPMKINFHMDNDAKITFYLAPRQDSEEDE